MNLLIRILKIKKYHLVLCLLLAGASPVPARAQNGATREIGADSTKRLQLDAVEVTGRVSAVSKEVLSADATSSPASVTAVGRDYVAKQAVLSYGDLIRPLAGVNVSNYQLGGVGYGIEMRGYTTTEHARDIFFNVDGVPQNQGSSIQTNGYVDLNMLIPETIQRIEVIRGPNSPLYGDHALGGVISFETENKMASSVMVSGGTYGYLRGLGTYGLTQQNGNSGYISLEGARTDGYRENSSDKHLNVFGKYSFHLLAGMASVRAQVYSSDFNSAGYIRRDLIDSGLIDRRSAVNPTDGGSTVQQNLVLNYKDYDTTNINSLTLYVQHHDFIRYSTFYTAQKESRDNRTWFGGTYTHTNLFSAGSVPMMLRAGVYFRGDIIRNSSYGTAARVITGTKTDKDVNTATPALFVQLQAKPVRGLKVTLGLRYDYLHYGIRTAANDGDTANLDIRSAAGVLSPKLGVSYSFTPGISLFANYAQGFRAPSAVDDIIMANGPTVVTTDLNVSRVTSYELGLSADSRDRRFHLLVSGYLSKQTGEIEVDPSGAVSNYGNTDRNGIDLEARVGLTRRPVLSAYGNLSYVDAKVTNSGEPGDYYITAIPITAGLIDLDLDFGYLMPASNHHFVLSVYDQFVGRKNLSTDGKIQSAAYQRLSGKLMYSRRNWRGFSVFAEGSYYPGNGALDETSFLLGGQVVTAPQAVATFDGGIRVPLSRQ